MENQMEILHIKYMADGMKTLDRLSRDMEMTKESNSECHVTRNYPV